MPSEPFKSRIILFLQNEGIFLLISLFFFQDLGDYFFLIFFPSLETVDPTRHPSL
jgi:hypothetical protein